MAIIEIIASNKTLDRNHLFLPINLYGLNLNKLDLTIVDKRRPPLLAIIKLVRDEEE